MEAPMPPVRSSVRIQKAARQAMVAIKSLADSIEELGTEIHSAAAAARANGMFPRRRRKLTPETRSFLKQQGRYLGLVRHLPEKPRAKVKAVKAKKGYTAAIREALKLQKSA